MKNRKRILTLPVAELQAEADIRHLSFEKAVVEILREALAIEKAQVSS
jgi:hypothetical protein